METIKDNSNILNISGINKQSIVDGPGLRFVVYTQGCTHNCPGCHNPATHSFNTNQEINIQDIIQQIKSNPLLKGVTISGGDPLQQPEPILNLINKIRETNSKLDIWLYTGYTLKHIKLSKINPTSISNPINSNKIDTVLKIIKSIDVLVDGPFKQELKTLDIPFVGSKNQYKYSKEQIEMSLQNDNIQIN